MPNPPNLFLFIFNLALYTTRTSCILGAVINSVLTPDSAGDKSVRKPVNKYVSLSAAKIEFMQDQSKTTTAGARTQDTVTEVNESVWRVIENAMNRAADYKVERDQARQQRDELLAATKAYADAILRLEPVPTTGLLAKAYQKACAAIARIEGRAQ